MTKLIKGKYMGMVFCRGCGKEIHETAPTCPHCGALQRGVPNTSGALTDSIPDGVKGWSWGAFLLSWIWAIGNRTWIGLLALIPYVGFIMAIVLGIKGREWAWKNNKWESVEHFNRVQKKWSFWGVLIIVGVVLVGGILAAIAIPAYQDYVRKAQHVQAEVAAKAAKSYRDQPALNGDISVSELESRIGQYGTKLITGVATNNTNKQFSYVQIELNLYDKDGVQVGSTLANTNNLEPEGKWRFEAPILSETATSYKLTNIAAF